MFRTALRIAILGFGLLLSMVVDGQGCVLPVVMDGQGCLIDLQGKPILPRVPYRLCAPEGGAMLAYSLPQYPFERHFHRRRHYRREAYGLLDLQGNVVIPVSYRDGKGFGNGLFAFEEATGEPAVQLAGKTQVPSRWRLAHRNGFLLDGLLLDDVAEVVVAGLLAVRKSGKIGLVDSSGKLVQDFDLDQVIYNEARLDAFWVRQADQWFAVTADAPFQRLDWPADLQLKYPCLPRDTACVDAQWMYPLYPGKDHDDPTIGCRDRENGYWKVGKEHQLISERDWNRQMLAKAGWQIKEKAGERALVDRLGNVVVDFADQDFEYDSSGFILDIRRTDREKMGVIDPQGNRILPPVHGQIHIDPATRTIVAKNGIFEDQYAELWSFEGKLLLKAASLWDFENGYCQAKQYIVDASGKGKLVNGIIDSLGNWVYQDTVHDGPIYYDNGWLFLRDWDHVEGKSLKNDSLLGPFQVDEELTVELMRFVRAHPQLAKQRHVIAAVTPALFQVGSKSGKFALYRRDGECILPKVATFVQSTASPEILEVSCGRRSCMVDVRGNVRVPLARQELSVVGCGLIRVRQVQRGKHLCGFVDVNGRQVIDFFEE
ncbi:MAG: WG repeat-containing protein [Bacteroidetes bacterium]|nr:WG repeat-containing protein [Bacteroidota bacterium]